MFLLNVLVVAASSGPPVHRSPVPVFEVPTIASLSPSSAVVGSAGITLVVHGTGFANNSKVRWQGSDRATTFISTTELRATITSADLATVGSPQVIVFTQGGNGGSSNVVAFTVGHPVPVIGSFTPPTGPAGSAAFTLQVNGSNFVAGSSVQWNGISRQTLFESPTRLSITVQATEVASVGSAQVRVANPAPGGGLSAPTTYAIQVAQPVLTSFSPSYLIRYHAPMTQQLSVHGTGFVNGSVVRLNGQSRATTFVSPNMLRAETLPGDRDTSKTTAQVTVRSTVGNSSQTSAEVTIQVGNPAPGISSITQDGSTPIRDGYASYAHVSGTGFGPWTSIYVDDSLMTSVHASSPSSLRILRTWRHGTATVRAENPGSPGGGSATKVVTVVAPPVSISSISPNVIRAGTAGLPISVKGSAFVPGAIVYVNGAPRTTILVSRTEVRAILPPSDLGSPRILQVRVRNPDPGSTTSTDAAVTVIPPSA